MIRAASIVLLGTLLCLPQPAHGGVGSSLLKGLSKFVGKEGVETSAEKLTKGVSEEVADRIATRLLKEGGEQAVDRAADLTAKHGPNVIRALDNTTNPSAVLKALDDLPIKTDVGTAASKLAAGEAGEELAGLTTKYGSRMLSAEIKHPGLATTYAKSLGDDGLELSMKLNRNQALDIGRHLDDIGNLPPEMRAKLLAIADKNPEGFAKYARQFVDKNPGKVLFTLGATAALIANPQAILGDAENPGWLERTSDSIFDRTLSPVVSASIWVLVPFLAFYAAWKLYKTWRIDTYVIDKKTSPKADEVK